MTIEDHYQRAATKSSDINEHLPVLKEYAEKCEYVTEFGVRSVVSTWAFLAARPHRLHSFDIEYHPNIEVVKAMAKKEGLQFDFILANTLQTVIIPTDFLFIDTLHTYEQLKQELERHAHNVSKYLAFHDTTTFAHKDETGQGRGLWPAIEEFMAANPQWVIELKNENNNGLTILKKNE